MHPIQVLKVLSRCAVIAAVVAFPCLAPESASLQAHSEHGNTLAGSWIVQVTPDADTGIPPFTNLASFAEDGRLVNVAPDGSGVGEWRKDPKNKFALTFLAF